LRSAASRWPNDPPGKVGLGLKKNTEAAPGMASLKPKDAVESSLQH